jgi:putative glutamine amidotransferase
MPLWAITQRLEFSRYGDRIDSLEQRYIEYFSPLVGALAPINNLPGVQPPDLPFDGVIITGGGELPNRFLGEDRLSAADNLLAEDKFAVQSRLLADAIAAGRRVIAVCYGLHLINAVCGGRLTWNVHGGLAERKPGAHHDILITKAMPGVHPDTVRVNSYHNQGIRTADLGRDLTAAALDTACDLVEAAVHRSGLVLGLQWHPERPSPDDDFNRRMLKAFMESRQ